jgi:hypothetical protein
LPGGIVVRNEIREDRFERDSPGYKGLPQPFWRFSLLRLFMELAQKPGLDFRVGTDGLGAEAKEIDCLGGFADSLPALRTTALEVFTEFRRTLVGKGPQQEQFAKVF